MSIAFWNDLKAIEFFKKLKLCEPSYPENPKIPRAVYSPLRPYSSYYQGVFKSIKNKY